MTRLDQDTALAASLLARRALFGPLPTTKSAAAPAWVSNLGGDAIYSALHKAWEDNPALRSGVYGGLAGAGLGLGSGLISGRPLSKTLAGLLGGIGAGAGGHMLYDMYRNATSPTTAIDRATGKPVTDSRTGQPIPLGDEEARKFNSVTTPQLGAEVSPQDATNARTVAMSGVAPKSTAALPAAGDAPRAAASMPATVDTPAAADMPGGAAGRGAYVPTGRELPPSVWNPLSQFSTPQERAQALANQKETAVGNVYRRIASGAVGGAGLGLGARALAPITGRALMAPFKELGGWMAGTRGTDVNLLPEAVAKANPDLGHKIKDWVADNVSRPQSTLDKLKNWWSGAKPAPLTPSEISPTTMPAYQSKALLKALTDKGGVLPITNKARLQSGNSITRDEIDRALKTTREDSSIVGPKGKFSPTGAGSFLKRIWGDENSAAAFGKGTKRLTALGGLAGAAAAHQTPSFSAPGGIPYLSPQGPDPVTKMLEDRMNLGKPDLGFSPLFGAPKAVSPAPANSPIADAANASTIMRRNVMPALSAVGQTSFGPLGMSPHIFNGVYPVDTPTIR